MTSENETDVGQQNNRRRKIVFEPSHSIWAFISLFVFFVAAWFFAHLGGAAAWVALVFSVLMYLSLGYGMLRWSLEPEELDKQFEESIDQGEDVFNTYAITIPFSFCGFFALASFSIFMIWGTDAYPAGQEGLGPWVYYLADNLFRATMFDFAETFYLDISSIEHTKVFLLCFFVFSFRTIAGIGLLSLVIRTTRMVLGRRNQN